MGTLQELQAQLTQAQQDRETNFLECLDLLDMMEEAGRRFGGRFSQEWLEQERANLMAEYALDED
jgi:hypothetical protein